jgi:hypothetical protein
MNSETSQPRTVAVFKFPVAGNIYVSDQEITIGNITYQALVSDWGTLEDPGDPETTTSDTFQTTITILNTGSTPFSDYFLTEDPESVEVELYQWFVGIPDIDITLIGRFIMQDPIEWDEASNLLKIDLVSLNIRYDNPIGPLLDVADYPDAKPSDLGKGIDLIVGSPGEVKTLAAKVGKSTTLDGPISASSTVITVSDDLSSWPASGTIQIGEEQIFYNSKSSSAFNVQYRGFNDTTAEDAEDGARVLQKTTHTYIVGQGPLASIGNIKVDGYQPSGVFVTSSPFTNPATITFPGPPYSLQFARSTDAEFLFFDDETSSNTADFPHNAFDGKPSTSAIINKNKTTLAIKQVNPLRDIGQISKVFVRVEHFATKLYKNDIVRLRVVGHGFIGSLSRPFKSDESTGSAEIDIDHDHDHKTGDRHTHSMNEPSYSAQVGTHAHALTGTATTQEVFPSGAGQLPIYQNEFSGFTDVVPTYSYTKLGTITNAFLDMSIVLQGCDLEILEGSARRAYFNSDKLGAFSVPVALTPPTISTIRFRVHGRGVVGGYVRISKATLIIEYAADMEQSKSAVNPFLSESGSNQNAYNTNNVDDVVGLQVPNLDVPLELSSPTKSLVDRVDITSIVDPYDWSYFQNREIQLVYVGTNDSVDIAVSEVSFEVAYKKQVRVYSDDVTCEPVAAIDNKPSEVINHLLVNIGGVPQNYIDSDVFEVAKTRYTFFDYNLNGIIDANITVREAIANILRQSRSRLFWNGGLAKLVLRESFENWFINKTIGPDEIQLKSISARRQRFSDIRNQITVLFDKDNTKDGIDAFNKNVTRGLVSSQQQHGNRDYREDWQFDLVTSAAMATDLAEYYISILATPSTFYDFNCYLNQFDLEKEDKIGVTSSGFNQMVSLPMVVKTVNRVFSNSETGQINLINIVAESLRYIKRREDLAEQVSTVDTISVFVGLLLDFSNQLQVDDDLSFSDDTLFDESLLVSDSFLIVSEFIQSLSESFTADDSAISISLDVELTDEVFAAEEPIFFRSFGYGAGGYGIESGYGGATELGQRNNESVPVEEILSADIDTPLTDSSTVADELAFGDGYGSQKLGDGYGTCPYGK